MSNEPPTATMAASDRIASLLPDVFVRSTESTIRFGLPFRLSQFAETLPAGSYRLTTEEECLKGPFEVFHRVRTLLYLPANGLAGRAREVVDVDPIELAAALIVDALESLGGPASSHGEIA
jgi:hypothetical protein